MQHLPSALMKIILDTNFLLSNFNLFLELQRIVDEPYELYILDKTIDELKNKKGESLAKNLIEKKDVRIIKTEKNKNVDNLLLDLADKEDFVVCTQDKDLKTQLKQKNIKIITIRQKTHLVFE